MKKEVISAIKVLFIAFLAYLFSYMDRMAWAPIIPLASKDLGINAAQAGSLMTAFYLGYVITQVPGGYLTDKYGYRKMLLTSFFITGFFTILTAFVHSYGLAFIVRFIAGMGSGAIFSAGLVAITDWFTEKRRGAAMGFFMTSTSFGISLVNLFVPSVAHGFGWRTAFFITGLLPFIGLLLGYFLLKERTPVHQISKKQNTSWHDIISLLKNKNIILMGIAGLGGQWATVGTATWANTYLVKSLHLSLVEAGAIMSLFGTAALLCKPLTGFLSDYLDRKSLAVGILLLAVPILSWFGANQNVSVLYFIAPMMGVCVYAFYPVLQTIIYNLVDRRLVGTTSGLVNGMWQIGSLTAPLAVGAVIDATQNYFYCFITLAAGPLLGAIATILIKVEKKSVADKVDTKEKVLLVEAQKIS